MSVVQTPQETTGDSLSHQASLLVSILVRYPEIGSVRFSVADGHLVFSFMLHGVHDRAQLVAFRRLALAHLDAFCYVGCHQIGHFAVNSIIHGNFTQVELSRDVATVSREELSLLIGLIRSQFGQDLVVENDEPLHDDERLAQEELIDEMLDDMRAGGVHRELVGFRDAGRVMVFNKPPKSKSTQGSSGLSQR